MVSASVRFGFRTVEGFMAGGFGQLGFGLGEQLLGISKWIALSQHGTS